MGKYRKQAQDMLQRWAVEVAEGNSKPNVLAADYIGGGERVLPSGPATFSPLAERADIILRDLRDCDPTSCDVLVCFALGLRTEDVARNLNTQTNKIQILKEGAYSAFEMGIHQRVKAGVWRELTDMKDQLRKALKTNRNLMDYLVGQ